MKIRTCKNAILLLGLMLTLALSVSAQTPQGFTYQAVVRDNGGTLLTNQSVDVEFKVLQNNQVVYHESHPVTTNDYGLFSLVVGNGQILSGDFGQIDWALGAYELNVQVNPGGGLVDMGTNALYSVPYSLYTEKAQTVENVTISEMDDLTGTPVQGDIIRWNGSQWEIGPESGGGGVISITGGGATTVSGSHPNFTITSTDNVNDADADPNNEIQSLSLSGTNINLSNGGGSVQLPYSAGTGINLNGTIIENTGDTNAADDITTSTAAGGDLSGTFPNLTVDGLNGNPLSGSAPSSGQVLKWNGSQWAPAADDNTNTTYSAGAGLSLTGTTFSNTGDTDASDDLTTSSTAGGDASGTFSNLTVNGLNGNPIAGTAPGTNQVLKWNGTQWAPAADNNTNTTYSAGTGLSLSGTTFNNTGDTDASDDLTTSSTAGGDASGTFANLTVNGLNGNPIAGTAPSNNQVLKWNGSQWAPAADNNTNTTYSAGTGLSLTGTTFSNTGDLDASDDITNSTAAGGDLSGSYPNPTVSGLDGVPFSSTAPLNNQVLKYRTATNEWEPAFDSNTQYSAGTGLSLSGTTFTNTGDTDASDDITNGTSAGGDLNGSYPNPQVTAIRGNNVASTAPGINQVLKWNGSAWAPGNDDSGSSIWNLNGSNDAYYNGGDVGIGTTNPDGSLEVSANSSLSDPHIWLHENGNDYARVNFDNNNGSNYWTIAAYIASNHRNDRLNFWNGTGGDVMTITGDGEVGIGVGISPKVPFHVGNNRRVLFGIDTLGNGDKLMFLPDLHAFRVGTVATGAASTYWNRDSIGLYSFASGYNTRAQGFGATAMGRDTEATNSYAFASGFFSNADGQYSTAMGFNTDAFALGSTALGYSTDAEANYSFAAGYFAEAQAIYSVAIGNAVRAQSYASMAVGRYNVGGGSATSWLSSDPIFEIGIGTGPSTRANAVTVRKNGNVGIGTTVPLDRLHVNGRVRLQTVEYIEDGGTSEIAVRGDLRPSSNNIYDIGTSSLRWDDVYATNGTINTSDRRDKDQIEDLPYGLEEVMQLRPVKFVWKDRPEKGAKLGLIAQDLLPVISEVVKTHDWQDVDESENPEQVQVEMERMGVYYSDLIPVLVQAIQDQQEIIDEQKTQMEKMEKRLSKLEKK